jgi:hypothetical protein
MIEDMDGFIFRRNVQAEDPTRKRQAREHEAPDAPDVFTFRFTKSSKRRSIEVRNDLKLEFKRMKRSAEEAETTEGPVHKDEELLMQSSAIITREQPLTAFERMVDVENLSNTFIVKEIPPRGIRGELHEGLRDGATIDDLVRLCVDELCRSRKTAYATSLRDAISQHQGVFKRRDIRSEIEEANGKIAWARTEEKKWGCVRDSVLAANRLRVNDMKEAGMEIDIDEQVQSIDREFAQKRKRLSLLRETAKLGISHIREQSEVLLKKILDIVCRKGDVDAFFLLRALSKACK